MELNYRYLYPGVSITFLDFNRYVWEEEERIEHRNVIEINHCNRGRFECEYMNDSFYYLGEGNLSVSSMTDQKKSSQFPMGTYAGINILIDLDQQDETFIWQMQQFGIQYDRLIQHWRQSLPCRIFEESQEISHIFHEMYEQKENLDQGYMRLKLMELLMFFQRQESPGVEKANQHFTKGIVLKVRKIRQMLEENLDQELTLDELAKQEQVSISTIKRCFQTIYGKSPNQYRKEYRMQAAAKMLCETDSSIAEIALNVGYLNSSKFSAAFHKEMKQSPSHYRIEKKYQ